MRKYADKITLAKNDRGVWGLDPFKGCSGGLMAKYHAYDCGLNLMFKNYNFGLYNIKGCYGICYAAKIAKFRGYDFSKVVKRDFIDDKHLQYIGEKLKSIPFVRLGVSCDPSSEWEHTLSIVGKIKPYIKNIVLITKHWNELTKDELLKLKGLCVNTSISALDNEDDMNKRLFWYHKLKDYCKSVLRVNTADFNDLKLKEIQDRLLSNEKVIDNVLRFSRGHELVANGIINVKKYKFLDSSVMASRHSGNAYFGYCDNCPDQCGILL